MSALDSFDQSVVLALSTIISHSEFLKDITIVMALLGVYVIPISWLVGWFVCTRSGRELLLSSLTAGVLAWQGINSLIKLIYYHPRPVHVLPVQELLFERPENSFPSDHTAFLFGIAIFFLLQKQYGVGTVLLILALITSIARVAVAVHYPSDIVGGFMTGTLAAVVIHFLHRFMTHQIWEQVLAVAHKVRLA